MTDDAMRRWLRQIYLRRRKFVALDLGPLPVALVDSVLRCALSPGVVHFSAANQDHSYARHGEQFLHCLRHVEATVLFPEYIGQSPHHPEGFEMVRNTGQGLPGHVLVALTLVTDNGRYLVQSVYPIDEGTVRRRLKKGHLFRVSQS